MANTAKLARKRFKHLSSHLLIYFVLSWSVANFVLVLFSTVAWITARIRVVNGPCNNQGVGCDFTRWGFYLFTAISAAISSTTAALMALNTLLRPRNSTLDPVWVFRGVFFTLIPLMTMVYIGWSTPDKPPSILKFPRQLDCLEVGGQDQLPLRGIGGAFILELIDPWKETAPAFVVIHINLFLGALLAGYSTAVCHAIVPLHSHNPASEIRPNKGLVLPPVA
ncbi:uncharacterized protein TrAFT101_010023 [Trichoderma asperellum]|nr:hypothetical protein TrAFT101_010023 [Trichoderma asperellum]